jgi:hypothetical protein
LTNLEKRSKDGEDDDGEEGDDHAAGEDLCQLICIDKIALIRVYYQDQAFRRDTTGFIAMLSLIDTR